MDVASEVGWLMGFLADVAVETGILRMQKPSQNHQSPISIIKSHLTIYYEPSYPENNFPNAVDLSDLTVQYLSTVS